MLQLRCTTFFIWSQAGHTDEGGKQYCQEAQEAGGYSVAVWLAISWDSASVLYLYSLSHNSSPSLPPQSHCMSSRFVATFNASLLHLHVHIRWHFLYIGIMCDVKSRRAWLWSGWRKGLGGRLKRQEDTQYFLGPAALTNYDLADSKPTKPVVRDRKPYIVFVGDKSVFRSRFSWNGK